MGPGLLYAGAAVGVSHLVQSTRAGAGYGFYLMGVLILANVLKYPFFEFAPRYAASTGKSLIDGYRNIGKWAIVMFTVLSIATMFTIQAAVTVVTAGLVGNVLGISLDAAQISGLILFFTMIILMVGRYAILDKLIKFVMLVLAVSTIGATIVAMLKGYHPNPEFMQTFSWFKHADILFLIAFVGWMPAPIDIATWQSLWTVAKIKEMGERPSLKNALLDFKIGYIGTAFLAVCFLSLGALVLYGSGEELSSNGVVFAGQLISVFTSSIGNWSYYIIAIAAITVMFSTTLTCLDAYPRVMKPLTEEFFPKLKMKKSKFDFHGWFWIVVVAAGALVLIVYLKNSMRFMVDMATTLSFVTAPLLAFLNYRVVTDKHMPAEGRPKLWLRVYAYVGMGFLGGFMVFYLVWRFL